MSEKTMEDCRPRKQIPGLGKHDPLTQDGSATATGFRFDLLPPDALLAAAQVMHEGAEKGYKEDGWRTLSKRDHLNHALGHIMADLDGYDEGDNGEDHLAHAMVRVIMAWAVKHKGGR